MKIKVFPNSKILGDSLGQEIVALVESRPSAILGLATGSSPLETYASIIARFREKGVSFANVKTFNLDEYLSCPIEEQTYSSFMWANLFSHIDIQKKNTHFPDQKELEIYDSMIDQEGGIDLQLLGIGRNGHIGFNEPGTPFDAPTHVVELTESTREANARFFHNDISLVPTHAVTMGIGTIKKSRRIVLIATTLDKVGAIVKLLRGEEDISCPVTSLIHHPNFEVYLTEEVNEEIKARMK
ncbi:MAG: glucosamine-6-phosphate deaminase [Candidatus Enteromonas sp.]|nr:glucosamine-6-phosphate deaminase [Candidatus Enteromonas sp.]